MDGRFHHLAQVNIACMRAPLDDPLMRGFTSRIDEIHALAEGDPGFVWRWTGSDATPFDDARLLFNLSVWTSVEALREYVYRSGHVELFRDRGEWFAESPGPSLALWWIPAGGRPDPAESRLRLDLLAQVGPSPFSFTFKQPFPEPPAPSTVPDPTLSSVLYDGRRFCVVENSAGGEVGDGTRFDYHQEGARVWATYSGGGVRFGSLVGTADEDGRLEIRYQHLSSDGEVREGEARSEPERLADGRLRLTEHWRWTRGATGSGVSMVEELPGD